MMRLQLLAREMETHEEKEMDADIVSVLHICPEANREFRERVTSPYLANTFLGRGTLEIWEQLVPQNKFKSISVEDLLNTILRKSKTDGCEWADYLRVRYGWAMAD